MNIFGGVTPVAIARRAFKSLRGVALRAGDDDVQAEERKIRQIMIEAHVGVPLRRRVALLARPPERAAVHVIGTVAAGAVDRQLLILDDRRMAGVTVDMRMRALQREFEAPMIEYAHAPRLVAMTASAIGAEAPGVAIVAAVTPRAVLWQGVLEVAAAMTVGAGNVCVRAFESEPGLASMVKLRRLPAGHRVTVCAFLAATAVVHIVRRVALGTLFRRAAIVLTHVAGTAGNVTVLIAQGELGLLMVKGGALPRVRRVTLMTIRTEVTAVRIFCPVTSDARHARLAKRYARAVAAVTSNRRVCPFEMKVGELMIETLAAQMYDVGIAAVVLAVAALTLTSARRRHAAVIAAPRDHVACNIFVAVEA